MTKQELYYKLTGTENPRFITEREEIIITKCLDLINKSNEALILPVVVRSLPTEEITDIDDLKTEWVYVINSFDTYKDKTEWKKTLDDLDKKIKSYVKR